MSVNSASFPRRRYARWVGVTVAGFLIFAGLPGSEVEAQEPARGSVTGSVTEEQSGQPIAGAQIYVAESGIGTLSDNNGRFALPNVPVGQVTLRTERLGYLQSELEVSIVAGQAVTLDIALERTALAMDEIVVTGAAGRARRREVGNVVAQVDLADEIEAVRSVDEALAARSPGVLSLRSSGMAGSGSQIRLRGNVSVSMSNQPLIYVDGVRMRSDGLALNYAVGTNTAFSADAVVGPMNDINPADIQRIEIVKGPAATALYGTEAAAGVIQIFTRRGSPGAPIWSAQIDQGVSWVQPFGPSHEPYLRMDPFLRNAHQQRGSLSVRGGSENITYYLSGSYDDNEGVLPNDFEEKLLLRSNLTFEPAADLQFDLNTSVTQQTIGNTPAGRSPVSVPYNIMFAAPETDSTASRNANYVGSTDLDVIRRLLDYELETNISRLVAGVTATWSPTGSLSNRFTVGLDRVATDFQNNRPYGFVNLPGGLVSTRRWTAEELTLDYVSTYDWPLTSALRTSLSWGGQWTQREERDLGAMGQGLPGPGVHTASSGASVSILDDRVRVINAGFFGQALFDLHDRYFLTVALRMDGNSAFGEGLGLQSYPRGQFSYVLSDESFWPEGWGDFRLRVAYGHAGRAPGAFDALRTWNPRVWLGRTAFDPGNLGNPDLGPERTVELEAGFDASFWDERVSVSLSGYDQVTDDALIPVTQIPTQGFLGSQLENVGRLSNRGVELQVNAVAFENSTASWDLGFTLYTNQSRVEDLDGLPGRGVSGGGWMEVGSPMPAVREDKLLNPDEIAEPEVERDHIFGPNHPTHTFTVSTGVDFANGIRLSTRGEYQGGHYMYDDPGTQAGRRGAVSPLCDGVLPRLAAGQRDQLTAFDRWYCGGEHSPSLVYPADFFRLRELTLQMPIPFAIPGASSGTLTVSGQNFWSWVNEDFLLFDPEMAGDGGPNQAVTRQTFEAPPPPASFRVSLRLTF